VPETGDQPKGTPGSGGLDANGPVVVYVRTGGIAGISERWEIFPDGRVVNQDGTEFQIDAEQVTKLVASFEQAGFFEMQPPGGPRGNCADCFTYEVAVRSGEKTNQVKFTDVDSNLPGAFMQTLQELNGMLDELKTP
jgi:hypothetical protein